MRPLLNAETKLLSLTLKNQHTTFSFFVNNQPLFDLNLGLLRERRHEEVFAVHRQAATTIAAIAPLSCLLVLPPLVQVLALLLLLLDRAVGRCAGDDGPAPCVAQKIV